MLSVLEVTYEIASTVVYGVGAFLILALGLSFVRNLGKTRPHS